MIAGAYIEVDEVINDFDWGVCFSIIASNTILNQYVSNFNFQSGSDSRQNLFGEEVWTVALVPEIG